MTQTTLFKEFPASRHEFRRRLMHFYNRRGAKRKADFWTTQEGKARIEMAKRIISECPFCVAQFGVNNFLSYHASHLEFQYKLYMNHLRYYKDE